MRMRGALCRSGGGKEQGLNERFCLVQGQSHPPNAVLMTNAVA
jgi:hypothetical protein